MQTEDHVFKARVYFEDTDAGGIVYHTSYLRFAERARTEMCRDKGFVHADFLKEHQSFLVVYKIDVRYKAPAFLDDELRVYSKVIKALKARLILEQIVCRDNQELVTITVELACIDGAGKPQRLPEQIKKLY